MKDIQQLISFAKVAQQTERYDDMAYYLYEATKKAIKNKVQIKSNERSLLANAYKCKIGNRRTAWRALCTLQVKENNSKGRTTEIIHFYKKNIEKQIKQICMEVLNLMAELLTNTKLDVKAKLQFYKMKGDYCRYLCEIASEQDLKKISKDCQNAYIQALEVANDPSNKQPMKTNPIKLGVCLNFSVFYYEIINNLPKAIEICEKGFNEALEAVSDLEDSRFTDTVTIMQLMHDNITSWKNELEKVNQ